MDPWPAMHACREARAEVRLVFIPPTPFVMPPPAWVNWEAVDVKVSQFHAMALSNASWSRKIVNLHKFEYVTFYENPEGEFWMEEAEQLLIEHLKGLKRLSLTPYESPIVRFGEQFFFKDTWCGVLRFYAATLNREQVVIVRDDSIAEEDWLTTQNYLMRRYFRDTPRSSLLTLALPEYLGLNVLIWSTGVYGEGLRNERVVLAAQENGTELL